MKKSKILLIIFICLFVCAACTEKTKSGIEVKSSSDMSENKGHLACSRSANGADGAQVELAYEIDYNKGYITSLRSIEKVISDNSSVLDKYESAYKKIFVAYKSLDYYTNKVTRSDTTVVSNTLIEYDKVDMDKLKSIEGEEDSVIKDGKVALSDWLEFAENFGTKCYEE